MKTCIPVVVLLAFLMLIPLCSSHQSSEALYQQYITTQDNTTTWHHDCSNTTGFTRVDDWNTNTPIVYGEMNSNGDYLWFNNDVDMSGIHSTIFVHEFNESFQLVSIEEFAINLGMYCSDGHDKGSIYISLVDEMFDPVLQTFSSDTSNNSYFDITGSFGNRFYPFQEYYSQDSVSYIRSSMSEEVTFAFVMGDDELRSSMTGYGSDSLYSDLGINNGRLIRYLVIEYIEYEPGDFNDWGFHIFDISLTYNTHTVETDAILELYYDIPQLYLWDALELYPDTTIPSQIINENETNLYYAIVTAGTWNITATHDDWLYVRIDVIVNETVLTSGVSTGDFPTIEFTVDEYTYVLVNVTENSPSGDSFGYYDILLTQIAVASITTDTGTNTSPGNGGFPDLSDMIVPITAITLLFIIVLTVALFKRKNESLSSSGTFEVSIQNIPRQYQQPPDDMETIRTIRLPVKCPQCDAPVIQEEIDWTGPLQAKCNYCGHPIRAKFERA